MVGICNGNVLLQKRTWAFIFGYIEEKTHTIGKGRSIYVIQYINFVLLHSMGENSKKVQFLAELMFASKAKSMFF